MGQADWSFSAGGLSVPSSIDAGVTTGLTPPPGGSSFVFGWNSLLTIVGSVVLYTNQSTYAPMAKGGSVRGAMCRLPGGGNTGFSVFCYICASGTTVNDTAYMLGLSDEDPHFIELRKGALTAGMLAGAPNPTGAQGILRKSTASYANNTWIDLRLDAIVNVNGDVILQCFQNDLTAGGASSNPLALSPGWAPIPGMESFTDDTLQINTGSAPYTSGYAGYGYSCTQITRRAAVDNVEVYKQN